MEFIFMTLLLFGTAFAPGGSDSSDDDIDSIPDDDLTPDTSLLGTEAGDILDFDDFDGDTLEDATVETLAGDDLIDFLDQADVDAFAAGDVDTPESRINIVNSTINAGEGDDTIRASLDGSAINAGDGDDVVTVLGANDAEVSGGNGNDTITIAQAASDGIAVGGDDGDDIIDVTAAENVDVKGGLGNDTISFSGTSPTGTGYTQEVTGNNGEDTINYSGSGFASDSQTPIATGGEGADTFNLTIDEVIDPATVPATDISDDGTINLSTLTITDFEAGEDVLVIDGDAQGDDFTLTNANLTVDDALGDGTGSSIELTYESDTQATRIVSIGLAEAQLSWDDVTFSGEQIPTLTQTDAPTAEPFVFTEGDDEFVSGRDEGAFTGDTLDLGAGNDTLDLLTAADADQDSTFTAEATTFTGGEGNDAISVDLQNVRIEGNEGDDTIVARNANNTTVDGGAGSDTITVTANDSDPVTVLGGDGDDTITAVDIDNGSVDGGEGDDLITFSGEIEGGAGYVINVTGGAGEDTLAFERGAITEDIFSAQTILGGEDADRFELTLNEGSSDVSDGIDEVDGTYTLEVVNIGDFVTAEDVVVIDGTSQGDAFTLATARLETVAGADGDETSLILRYESDTELNREVVIGFGTAAVTFDDIAFVGSETPVIQA